MWCLSDRFLGHPMSVDTLLKVKHFLSSCFLFQVYSAVALIRSFHLACQLDEDKLISGSEDGVIRLIWCSSLPFSINLHCCFFLFKIGIWPLNFQLYGV